MMERHIQAIYAAAIGLRIGIGDIKLAWVLTKLYLMLAVGTIHQGHSIGQASSREGLPPGFKYFSLAMDLLPQPASWDGLDAVQGLTLAVSSQA